jgi:cell division septation protein DedD
MVYGGRPFKSSSRSQRLFRPKRRSRRGPTIAIILVLGLIGGGWLWAFQEGPKSALPGGVPIIKADDQPMRKRPDEPGGMKIPDLDKLVYNTGKAEPKVEHLLPPPETPLPRPAADPMPAPADAAGAAPTSTDAASNAPSSSASPAPAVPAASANTSSPSLAAPQTPTASALPPAPPTQVAAAPATVAPPAPAPLPPADTAKSPTPPSAASPPAQSATPVVTKLPGDKAYRLQLASVRSADDAAKVWEKLKRANGDVLGSMNFTVMSVELPERGTYYRVLAGPISEEAAASFACDQLKRRGTGCILVKP